MLGPTSQSIHGCATNIGAIEIDSCAIGFTIFANVSRSTRLSCMDGFFTCLDSWDHVPIRSWPLFKARHVLRTLHLPDFSPIFR